VGCFESGDVDVIHLGTVLYDRTSPNADVTQLLPDAGEARYIAME
jgi:hypothetical protein